MKSKTMKNERYIQLKKWLDKEKKRKEEEKVKENCQISEAE